MYFSTNVKAHMYILTITHAQEKGRRKTHASGQHRDEVVISLNSLSWNSFFLFCSKPDQNFHLGFTYVCIYVKEIEGNERKRGRQKQSLFHPSLPTFPHSQN